MDTGFSFLAPAVLRNVCNCKTLEPNFPHHSINHLAAFFNSGLLNPSLSDMKGFPLHTPFQIGKMSDYELLCVLLLLTVLSWSDRILLYLEKAEHWAANHSEVWAAEDLRVAQLVVTFASEGSPDPYVHAFIKLYAKHPSGVVGWWRDPLKLARIAQYCNSALPLLNANRAAEALRNIPDYDYSQVSSGGAHAERPDVRRQTCNALAFGDASGHRDQPHVADTASTQSGPLENLSPELPCTPGELIRSPHFPRFWPAFRETGSG